MSLAAHLAALDATALTALLHRRPDVLVEPAPLDMSELADRLGGVDSLSRALETLDADELAVVRTVALLGPRSAPELASDLKADPAAVADVVGRLVGRALAWPEDGHVTLPARLAAHVAGGLDAFRPIAAIAKQARSEDVKVAVAGLGGDPAGGKGQLVTRLTALVRDRDAVVGAFSRLTADARRHLVTLLDADGFLVFGDTRRSERELVAAGLLILEGYGRPALPREVAAILLRGAGDRLTGRPSLPASTDAGDDGRAAAQAFVLELTGLLDEATASPLAALKKGGVGARERKRLAARLGTAEPALTIDIADALGLLARTPAGYAATGDYGTWRDEPVAARWPAAARAWFALPAAPTHRETADGEVPPPLPFASPGGLVRRAVLRAAAGGRSVRAAAAAVDWFCPLHGDEAGAGREVEAALREAERIGVVSGDRLTALGELLIASDDLAASAADLLPETPGLLVLQSDLSAVVSGQTSAAAARVLAAAALPEGHGAAATWQFSPASVRAALDAGWTAETLRAELVAVSGRELPQPLDYLIGDVARRHGAVRVRATLSCVTGSEADIAEILHTRGLVKLELRRIAPTVLTSAAAPDAVLDALRKASFAPVPEDADGTVVRAERPAAPAERTPQRRARPRVEAAELAARLLAGRRAGSASSRRRQFAALNPRLDSAEIALLADALDHGRDVRIRYRNNAGNYTVRDIAPQELWDRWLHAYCYLRSDERDFSVSGIEAVAPAG